jgi:hypothetical protein
MAALCISPSCQDSYQAGALSADFRSNVAAWVKVAFDRVCAYSFSQLEDIDDMALLWTLI